MDASSVQFVTNSLSRHYNACCLKPQSHCGEFWHSLHHRSDSSYFLLVCSHFRIRPAAIAGQYEMFKTFAGALRSEAYSFCIMSILVGSYLTVVHSYQFVADLHRLDVYRYD